MTIRNAIAMAFALLLAGCGAVTTTHEIGTTAGLRTDLALVGTWKDDVFRQDFGQDIHVVPVGQGTLTAFESRIRQRPDDVGSFTIYSFTTAKLGDNHFINADVIRLEGDKSAKRPGWLPLFYTVRGNSLKLYYLEQERAAKAIEAGLIAGRIDRHQRKSDDGKVEDVIDNVEITAEPAALDAFMAKPEAVALFRLYMQLRKIE